jgi:hypothetical protein
MSSEPLDRQILADHLDRTMMMGTEGNRAEGNEGEHKTSMGWGAWDGEHEGEHWDAGVARPGLGEGGGARGRGQGWEAPGLG